MDYIVCKGNCGFNSDHGLFCHDKFDIKLGYCDTLNCKCKKIHINNYQELVELFESAGASKTYSILNLNHKLDISSPSLKQKLLYKCFGLKRTEYRQEPFFCIYTKIPNDFSKKYIYTIDSFHIDLIDHYSFYELYNNCPNFIDSIIMNPKLLKKWKVKDLYRRIGNLLEINIDFIMIFNHNELVEATKIVDLLNGFSVVNLCEFYKAYFIKNGLSNDFPKQLEFLSDNCRLDDFFYKKLKVKFEEWHIRYVNMDYLIKHIGVTAIENFIKKHQNNSDDEYDSNDKDDSDIALHVGKKFYEFALEDSKLYKKLTTNLSTITSVTNYTIDELYEKIPHVIKREVNNDTFIGFITDYTSLKQLLYKSSVKLYLCEDKDIDYLYAKASYCLIKDLKDCGLKDTKIIESINALFCLIDFYGYPKVNKIKENLSERCTNIVTLIINDPEIEIDYENYDDYIFPDTKDWVFEKYLDIIHFIDESDVSTFLNLLNSNYRSRVLNYYYKIPNQLSYAFDHDFLETCENDGFNARFFINKKVPFNHLKVYYTNAQLKNV